MAAPRMMLPLVSAALILGCAPRAERAQVSTEADRQAIDAVRDQEVEAFNTGDMSLAYATDDLVNLPPGEPATVGKAAAQAWMEGFFAVFTPSLTYTSADVIVDGDLAVEHYTGSATLTPTEGGEAMVETFKGIHIYQRQADGSWKMTHDVWNFDAPPGGE